MNEVEEYIHQFDPDIQDKLNTLRQVFFEVCADAKESIRYKMPAYQVGNAYLYFAAYKKHIGLYPVYGLPEIEDEILPYRGNKTKDSLHFPHNKPLPVDLLKKIIKLKSES